MIRTILLVSLMFSFGMSQQTDRNNESTNVNEETEILQTQDVQIQEENISEQYYKNEQVNAKCQTSPQSGTYTEYHPNGMLKAFRIVH